MYLPAGSRLEIPGRSALPSRSHILPSMQRACIPVLNYDGSKDHPRDDSVEENNGKSDEGNELKLR